MRSGALAVVTAGIVRAGTSTAAVPAQTHRSVSTSVQHCHWNQAKALGFYTARQSSLSSRKRERWGADQAGRWPVRQRSKHMACAAVWAPPARRDSGCRREPPAAPSRTPSCSWTTTLGSSETASRAGRETPTQQLKKELNRAKALGAGAPRTRDTKIFGPWDDTWLWLISCANQSGGWDFFFVSSRWRRTELQGSTARSTHWDLNMDGVCGGERGLFFSLSLF